MPKLACAAWGFREYTPPRYFAAARQLGLEFVEINIDEGQTRHLSPSDSDADLQKVARQAADEGVKIVAVAGGNDFTVPDAAARAKQVDAVKRQLDVCATLGAEVLRIFAGWAGDKQVRDETFGWVRDCLEELAPYAEKSGVTIAVENHGGVTKTGAECLRLLRDMPRTVGLNYDPANFRHADEDPLAALLVTRDRIVYTHWKDVKLVDDGWEYCAMGEGVIAWQPIVAELLTFYDGYWAIEYENPADVQEGTKVCLDCLTEAVSRVSHRP